MFPDAPGLDRVVVAGKHIHRTSRSVQQAGHLFHEVAIDGVVLEGVPGEHQEIDCFFLRELAYSGRSRKARTSFAARPA